MAAMEQFESRSSRIRLDLPDELVAEILLRMPAKSIARFRCVSTTWLSISTDPSFIRAHARRSPNSVFVCSTKKTNLESFGRDLLSFSATGIIERRLEQIDGVAISSCDGLTLFLKESIHQFYVMNLATGLHIDLPYLNTNDKFDRVSELYYHRWTREYRVINICTFTIPCFCSDVQVLSLTDAYSWRKIAYLGRKISFISPISPALVNDRLHWISNELFGDQIILVFDIFKETFDFMELPNQYMLQKCLHCGFD